MRMADHFWLLLATSGYLLSSLIGFYSFFKQKSFSGRANNFLFFISFLFHSLFLHERGRLTGHCPIGNPFEIAIFFSWSLALTYFVIGPAFRMSILGLFTAPLVFLINFMALLAPIDFPARARFLNWKVELHASLILLGFGILGLAALAGLLYLIQERQLKRHQIHSWFYRLPAMGRLEIVHRRILIWAFLLFSSGMIAGFFIPPEHHNQIKIIWSAMVWLLYAVLLLRPKILALSQKKIAWLSLGGYIFVLLTFWVVNLLTTGLGSSSHSALVQKKGSHCS